MGLMASSGMLFDSGVAAAIVEQWASLAGGPADYSREHDGVITARILGTALALDVGQSPAQENEPIRSLVVSHAVEAVLMPVGKATGQRFLRARKNVYCEELHLEDRVVHFGFVIHAHRDERRIQRNRGKTVGGHSQEPPLRSGHGEHCHAGGKPAQELAELSSVDLGGAQRTIREMKAGLNSSRTGTNPPATPIAVWAMSS